MHLIAAFSYPDWDSRWSATGISQYAEVLSVADLVEFISLGYSMAPFQKRGEWIVDHSARVVAVYDGVPRGTKNTIDYASKFGVEIEYG